VGIIGEIIAHLYRVVMQEIDRFAHFGDGVGEGFAGFAHQQAQQWLCIGLPSVRRRVQESQRARTGGVACQIGPAAAAHVDAPG
jgi:hypothetical protein